MIYLSYICTRNSAKGELSSVGSERLPYKQRVGGSNPSAPTDQTKKPLFQRVVFCFSAMPANLFAEGICEKRKIIFRLNFA